MRGSSDFGFCFARREAKSSLRMTDLFRYNLGMPLTFYKKPAFVAYVTCGDPDLATTREIVLAAIEAGADVIELGVPFSDPVADGPVIQRASERALKHGTSLAQVLTLAAEIRVQEQSTGLIVFSYLNPILRMGMEKFCKVARAAGVDGALVVDLPVEEAGGYRRAMREYDLSPIFLAAPTSPEERLWRIAEASRGFVYAVSRTGVTGQRQQLADDAKTLVKRLRRVTKLPIALGFGISSAAQFAEVGEFADAVVVGSAIVETIERSRGREAMAVGEFVRRLTTVSLQPVCHAESPPLAKYPRKIGHPSDVADS
jgi:tryptophan synthase alpha chain